MQKIVIALCITLSPMMLTQLSLAQNSDDLTIQGKIVGSWVINEALSDNTDDAVETAIKEAGGKVRRSWFSRREEDFYRGGPEEQELYDRISYDDVLRIEYAAPEFRFEYADNYVRLFHTDGRRRTTTANSFYESGGEDFSFANFEQDSLILEARPRDGGFTLETYTLQANDQQLVVEMVIHPGSFGAAIRLLRVYDRQAD